MIIGYLDPWGNIRKNKCLEDPQLLELCGIVHLQTCTVGS